MNDPTSNLSSEQELETRITALVLGEASAFERDQIARLIEQRPDLAEMKARLEMVHGLLHDVGKGDWAGEEAGDWKLPASKRNALMAALESETIADLTESWRPVPRFSRFTLIASLVCAACLVVVVGLWKISGSQQVAMVRSLSQATSELSSGSAVEYVLDEESVAEYAAADDAPAVAFQRPGGPEGMGFEMGGMGGGVELSLPMSEAEGLAERRTKDVDARFYRSALNDTAEFDSGRVSGRFDVMLGMPLQEMPSAETATRDKAVAPLAAMPQARSPDSKQGFPTVNDFAEPLWAAGSPVPSTQDTAGSREYAGRGLGRLSESASESFEFADSSNGVAPLSAPTSSVQTFDRSTNNGRGSTVETLVPQEPQAAVAGKPQSGESEQEERAFDLRTASDWDELSRRRLSDADVRAQSSVENEVAEMASGQQQEFKTDQLRDSLEDDLDLYFGREGGDHQPLSKRSEELSALDADRPLEQKEANLPQLSEEAGKKLDGVARGEVRRELQERVVVIPPESDAAAEPFSTFSLHVSDVSFKLAAAALAEGQWPAASEVRIEEFVNALDYGDPLPSQHEKVACQIEQCIDPFAQQRNLLRVSLRTAAAGRAAATPLRLTLLLDNSGSMERIDRQHTVRRAFVTLAEQLQPNDQITLISFARTPRLLADRVSGAGAKELVDLIEHLPSDGGTNIEAALQLAWEKSREQWTEGAQNRIILLTDGAVNLGDANPERLANMVSSIRDSGIAFDAAGISANGLNDEVLEALTRKGDGRYYLLDSAESVDDGFARQIAGALRPAAMNVKVQIEFNPLRVGNYRLLGFQKHRLNEEDFRNDQVDAAEMAAAEAGVAVYQFEAKPDGQGDVGSISVRFRDMASGQMVERRWPIVYQPNPPRADQTSASLRLATVSALFAAKLSGGPVGESVDLKVLSELLAGLPPQNRVANRVRQLEQMIQQARQINGQ
ncbi:vWA domain-containing protein [Allorhodopirellula heiligendammensis]|uniref:von Willebrand factor n=1 Tax=Allorhodopirellula heiligendammensis TaxID=2714739 RepID=A0A5C6BT97_9BACT|nr:von Willebrand factor type A domain-containing protein [Allorhodopirellula heiligendammensis]TWU15225.1 von Willebrand factor [Allorhodopirellula heiligendammensis]